MSRVKKTISIADATEKTIKKIAKDEKRTESAVVELAVEAYAAKREAANN